MYMYIVRVQLPSDMYMYDQEHLGIESNQSYEVVRQAEKTEYPKTMRSSYRQHVVSSNNKLSTKILLNNKEMRT